MPVNAFPRTIYTNDSEISYFQNTDFSSWTFLDPNSMINSSNTSWSSSTGLHVETNAVSVADDTLQIQGSAGVCNAPRFYKLAYYDDGSPVMTDDNFIITVCIEHVGSTANNLSYFNWGFGVCESPTSTDITVIGGNIVGTAWNAWAGTAGAVFGMLVSQEAASTTQFTLTPDDTHTIGTSQFAGGGGGMIANAIDASGSYEASAVAAAVTTEYTPSNQLYMCLMMGAKGTGRTYTAGQATQIRVRYKFSKLDNNSMGL
jgi:hypothetical protein